MVAVYLYVTVINRLYDSNYPKYLCINDLLYQFCVICGLSSYFKILKLKRTKKNKTKKKQTIPCT